MPIETVFPTLIYREPIARKMEGKGLTAFNSELTKECIRFSEIDKKGQDWSKKNYHNGYTSYGSIANLHEVSSTFMNLQKQIDKHVAKFAKAHYWNVDTKCLQMVSFWINIMPPNAIHTFHIHPLSVVSGTYYVQTPPGCSAIKFEDPRLDCFMAAPPRLNSAPRSFKHHVEVQPKAGDVVLFESWLRHEVPQNRTQMPRISVSFNYNWV